MESIENKQEAQRIHGGYLKPALLGSGKLPSCIGYVMNFMERSEPKSFQLQLTCDGMIWLGFRLSWCPGSVLGYWDGVDLSFFCVDFGAGSLDLVQLIVLFVFSFISLQSSNKTLQLQDPF